MRQADSGFHVNDIAVLKLSATQSRRPTPLGLRLIAFAERWFDIPEGAVQNPKRRNGNVSRARWAVAHVLSQDAGWSQPKIASLYGCNASSIHTGQCRAKELLRTDAVFFDAVERLQREIAP